MRVRMPCVAGRSAAAEAWEEEEEDCRMTHAIAGCPGEVVAVVASEKKKRERERAGKVAKNKCLRLAGAPSGSRSSNGTEGANRAGEELRVTGRVEKKSAKATKV